ncbi:unnamed protein product [Mytilus coruscus]|uniref:Uncharacterized protein n=1 Tax=Mytilus coruscus TaxID=42192 RepID=A0A6J8F0R8_MYTCO|nr:unnamed protein product [Mytilus coruscus]
MVKKESKRPCFKISIPGDGSHFNVKKLTQKGHVAAIRFTCDKDKHHSVLWSSSPYLPNGEYMVNSRIFHGYECSGMLPVHYNKFSQGANIGHINKSKKSYMFNYYKQFVDEEYNGSIETALMEQVGMYEDLTSIDILTDARHSWRKNAKDTTIGEKMHKVLKCEHVTKADDFVSQRHEKHGTQRIYKYLEDNDVKVGIHSHDSDGVNQNDSWHGIKAVKSAMKKVSSGPKYVRDKTWSDQLEDKDERTVFSDANYHTRVCLAVCHWNENVDRGFTSIWNPKRRNAPSSMKGKKNYKPTSYTYRNNICKRQINSIYL